MLSAAEAQMDAAAEDDAERARNWARLYAPPKGARRSRTPQAGAMTREQAMQLAQQVSAEDNMLRIGRVAGQ